MEQKLFIDSISPEVLLDIALNPNNEMGQRANAIVIKLFKEVSFVCSALVVEQSGTKEQVDIEQASKMVVNATRLGVHIGIVMSTFANPEWPMWKN